MHFSRCICLFLILGITPGVLAQTSSKTDTTVVNDDFIQKQFGATCSLAAGPPTYTADLDRDGIEDAVIVAKCTNPLMDETENNFKVLDPYNSFFGYGDTKATSQFASADPLARSRVLLVIHGAGVEAWHSDKPKAKFVIINLPFKQIAVRKLMVKKKSVMAIYAEESSADQMTSAIFWDGKKYRYQPLGAGLE
ncbi:MAG: hypothetical protein AUH36_03460 [Chloroflexi bacterium 13_1_40CM_55_7]|jgi:hypothetical protein|nr:MAG: hypothetical protein AUH36_03460 [Chloroflexi bacterium 13_1_40CM_55_7]